MVHDDDLDWYAQGVVKVEEFASPASPTFKVRDVSVAFDITVLRWHEGFKMNVLEFSGSLYFKIGKDDANPFFELSADVQYRHPCRRGDKMHVKNVEMNLNIKPLSVSDLTGSAVLYCNAKQDEMAYEFEASMDKLALGSIVIANVELKAGVFSCALSLNNIFKLDRNNSLDPDLHFDAPAFKLLVLSHTRTYVASTERGAECTAPANMAIPRSMDM